MSLDVGIHEDRIPTGRRGYTAQTHSEDRLRKLLATIQRQNPRFDEYEVCLEFWEQVQKPSNKEVLKAAVFYAAKNNLVALRRLEIQEERETERNRGVNALGLTKPQTAARIQAFVADSRRKLMDEIVINGKKLGDLTGKDLRKLGGNCARLSQKVPPTKKVRDVLSHEEFNKLWKM